MIKTIGALIIAVGIIWTGSAISMDVVVGGIDKVYNSGLIASRQLHAMVGLSITISGIIVIMGGLIIEKMNIDGPKRSLQTPEDPTDSVNNKADREDSRSAALARELAGKMPGAKVSSIMVTFQPEINHAAKSLSPYAKKQFEKEVELELSRIIGK